MSPFNRAWKWLAVVLIITATGLMAACKTMEGMGKDMEKAGEKVQDAADGN